MKNRIIAVLVLLAALLVLTACKGAADTPNTPSTPVSTDQPTTTGEKEEPATGTDSAADSTDMEKLVASLLGSQAELTPEEKLVYLVVKAGLDTSWDNADENPADNFIYFYEYLGETLVGAVTLPQNTNQMPAADLEATVLQYFDVEVAHLQTANYYRADSNTYEMVGLGGASDARVTGITEQDSQKAIAFARYQDAEFLGTGVLTVALLPDDGYKILSCKTAY